jgi:hypothetical protein
MGLRVERMERTFSVSTFRLRALAAAFDMALTPVELGQVSTSIPLMCKGNTFLSTQGCAVSALAKVCNVHSKIQINSANAMSFYYTTSAADHLVI